jgi:DNA-binding transcriptional LysR family regulator
MTDWDDVRFFLEIARSGGITAAARVLKVNHTTVSRRLQSLEEKHGVRLFEKLSSGYVLTTAGASIYDLSLEIEEQNLKLLRSLYGRDSRLQGDISITMPHDIYEYCLTEEIASFRELQPDIVLNMFVAQGLKNLAAREADVAIRLTPSPPDFLIGKNVATLQHGIYKNVDASLENRTPIVAWVSEKSVPEWALKHFGNPYIAMRVDDLYSMYLAVLSGVGIARMPCYLPDSLQSIQVKRLNIHLPKSSWGVWVLSHVDLRNTARVRCCREYLSTALEQKKDLFEGECSSFN